MMEHLTIRFKNLPVISIIGIFLMWSLNSCYYDNEEELYPNPVTCDTANITYMATVVPILEVNCYSCHNSVNQQGGIVLDTYNDLQTSINNGTFRGTINHLDGYSPMPKGGNKLNDCDLTQINLWLDNGAPNN
jgi:hypothetical protein